MRRSVLQNLERLSRAP